MGDMLFIDVVSVFNGYKTCYYQTFCVGKPSQKQLDVYKQCYDWLFDAINMVKPGVSTADIAGIWPGAEGFGPCPTRRKRLRCRLGTASALPIGENRSPAASFRSTTPRSTRKAWSWRSRPTAGKETMARESKNSLLSPRMACRMLSKFPSKRSDFLSVRWFSSSLIQMECVGPGKR